MSHYSRHSIVANEEIRRRSVGRANVTFSSASLGVSLRCRVSILFYAPDFSYYLPLSILHSVRSCTSEKELKKGLTPPIGSEIRAPFRERCRSIFRLRYLRSEALSGGSIPRPTLYISYSKSRSYYERSFYKLSKFSTRERRGGTKTRELAHGFSFAARLLNFI